MTATGRACTLVVTVVWKGEGWGVHLVMVSPVHGLLIVRYLCPIVFIIQYCAYLYIDWADRTVSFVTLLGCLPFMECDHYVIRYVVRLVHLPWFSRVVRHYYLCMVSITQYQRKYLFLLFAIAFQDFFQPWPYKFHKYIKIDLANLVESYFFFDKSHVVSALVRITTNAHLLTFS